MQKLTRSFQYEVPIRTGYESIELSTVKNNDEDGHAERPNKRSRVDSGGTEVQDFLVEVENLARTIANALDD